MHVGSLGINLANQLQTPLGLPGCILRMVHKASRVLSESRPEGRFLGNVRLDWRALPAQHGGITAVG